MFASRFTYRPTQCFGLLAFCIYLFIVAKPSAAATDIPAVVTDTPMIQSLVAMVMGDIGSPTVLISGNVSPHDFALRPSEAATLQSADLLIWTSRHLTPGLDSKIQTLAPGTPALELMSAPLTLKLVYRKNNLFTDSHDHGHDSDHDSDKAEKNATIDPHGWLDPVNAIYWIDLIAEQLITLDSQNADNYRTNATAAQQQLKQLQQRVAQQLKPASGKPFIVFHDSYHYFEDRFNVFATAAIALSDADLPSIRQLNTLRSTIDRYTDVCVFTEPQFSDKLVRSLARDLDISIAELDPLGSRLNNGPDLYIRTIEQLSETFTACLEEIPKQ